MSDTLLFITEFTVLVFRNQIIQGPKAEIYYTYSRRCIIVVFFYSTQLGLAGRVTDNLISVPCTSTAAFISSQWPAFWMATIVEDGRAIYESL